MLTGYHRIVQLTYVSDNTNDLIWAGFMNKFKEGISSAFSNAMTVRREEVRRSEGQQAMPGWNFCTFFVLKVRSLEDQAFRIDVDMDERKVLQPRMKGSICLKTHSINMKNWNPCSCTSRESETSRGSAR